MPWLHRLYKASGLLSAASLVLICVLILAQVVARNLGTHRARRRRVRGLGHGRRGLLRPALHAALRLAHPGGDGGALRAERRCTRRWRCWPSAIGLALAGVPGLVLSAVFVLRELSLQRGLAGPGAGAVVDAAVADGAGLGAADGGLRSSAWSASGGASASSSATARRRASDGTRLGRRRARRHLVRAARAGRVGGAGPDRRRHRRHAGLRRCAGRLHPRHHELGLERELDDDGAAAVHLDGRDPVPHAACPTTCSPASRPGSSACRAGCCMPT